MAVKDKIKEGQAIIKHINIKAMNVVLRQKGLAPKEAQTIIEHINAKGYNCYPLSRGLEPQLFSKNVFSIGAEFF